MKITVYTVTDCQFSKTEKEYLASHTLQFEEKNLETNKEFLTEMLAVSNNFAGTPVTKVEKDDGSIVVLKGFTKEEFDQTLGFAQPVSAVASAKADTNSPPVQTDTPAPGQPQPVVQDPNMPAPVVPPPTQDPTMPSPVSPPPTPTPVEPPTMPPVPDMPPAPAAITPEPAVSAASTGTDASGNNPMNSILTDLEQKSQNTAAPQTPPANLPNIPDFRAKT